MGSGQSVDDRLARALLPELWHEVGSWMHRSERWFLAENIAVFSDRYHPPFTPEGEHRDALNRLALWNKSPESKHYPRDVTRAEAIQHPGRDFNLFYTSVVGAVGRMHRCTEEDLAKHLQSGQVSLVQAAFEHEASPFVPDGQPRPFIILGHPEFFHIPPENRGTLTHVLDWSYRRYPRIWTRVFGIDMYQWNNYATRAAMAPTVNLLKWMHSVGSNYWSGPLLSDWFKPQLIEDAINARQDTNVIWMKSKGLEWSPDALRLLVYNNRIHVLKHASARELVERAAVASLIDTMARQSTAEVWDFVHQECKLPVRGDHLLYRQAFIDACMHGNLPIMKRIRQLAEWRPVWCNILLGYARSTAMIDWMLLNGASTPTTPDAFEHQVLNNRNLDVLKHVRRTREGVDENTGHYKHDPWPWSEKCCETAFERSEMDTLNWLIENGCPCPQSLKDLIAFRSNPIVS